MTRPSTQEAPDVHEQPKSDLVVDPEPRRPFRRAGGAVLALAVAVATALGAASTRDADPASAATAVRSTSLHPSWGDTTPVAGQRVLLFGFAFPATAGRLLEVQTPAARPGAWRTVGTVRTVSNGSYTVFLKHTVGGVHRYRLHAARTAAAGAADSPTVRFSVTRRATALTAAVSARSVGVGRAAHVTGTLGPDFTARTVTVQRRAAGTTAWSRVGAVRLNGSSRYTVAVPTAVAGRWEYRALVAATGYADAAESPVVALSVTTS
jgi:hypothetical protein